MRADVEESDAKKFSDRLKAGHQRMPGQYTYIGSRSLPGRRPAGLRAVPPDPAMIPAPVLLEGEIASSWPGRGAVLGAGALREAGLQAARPPSRPANPR